MGTKRHKPEDVVAKLRQADVLIAQPADLGPVIDVGGRDMQGHDMARRVHRQMYLQAVVADDHKGLRAATAKVFSATHRRCRVPWMRNALAHVAPKQRPAVAAMLETIFVQDGAAAARAQGASVAGTLRERYPKRAGLMDEAREDVLAYMAFPREAFPREHGPQIASTNPLERLNGEIERRSDVIGIVPDDRAVPGGRAS